jgi:diaminopimelate decarboxylase
VSPFVDTLRKLKGFISELREAGIAIEYLDLGGGLGITYDKEEPPDPGEYAAALKKELDVKGLTVVLEPGRVITGNAGILVAKVLYVKRNPEKNFIIIDAAMNDLIRPSLYGSFHAIQAVRRSERRVLKADVVGPICESTDFLAKERDTVAFEPGDLMAVMSAGAYGFSMASNYNSRPRVPEVMGKGDRYFVIRARETYEDLVRGETIPDFMNE